MTLRRVLLCVAAAAAMSSVFAQNKPAQNQITTVNEAHEVRVARLTLPASESGAAVFAPCYECAPKSFPASADTKYFLKNAPVSLAEFRAAVLGKPNLGLTVKVSVKTGALVSIGASVAPPATPRRAP